MKRVILILSIIIFSTILQSCGSVSEKTISRFTPHYYYIKCAMSDEIKFVQQIMDNPQDIQHIIETSKYYDTTVTEFYFLQKENPDKDIYAEYIEWLIDFEPKFHKYYIENTPTYCYWNGNTYNEGSAIYLRRKYVGDDFWWSSLYFLSIGFVKVDDTYKLYSFRIFGKGALLPQIHFAR